MQSWDKGKRPRVKVKSTSRTFALFLFAFTLLVSSCTTKATREPAPEVPLQQATIEQLTALLKKREAEIQTLKGLFRAQIQGPGIPGTQHVEGAVVYHRPDALRLRGFNRLGMRLFELAVGEDRYTLRLVNGKVLTGSLVDLNRAEKIARPFRLSVLAMTGIIGTPSIAANERATLNEDADRYRVDVFSPINKIGFADTPYRQIWFDRRSLQVVREDRLTPAGDVEATVSFEDFRAVNLSPDGGVIPTQAQADSGSLRPFVIHAQDNQSQSSIHLTFRELAPNLPLKADEWQVMSFENSSSGKMG